MERSWASPADLAIATPLGRVPKWGDVLPAGAKARTTIEGGFYAGGVGFLRVYRGEPAASDLLAMRPGTVDCVEMPLEPGQNDFVVENVAGKLSATLVVGKP